MGTTEERINEFIKQDLHQITTLFSEFDKNEKVICFYPMKNGMTNSGYVVETEKRKYLLKIYAGVIGKCEIAMYKKLKDTINIPKLFYFNDKDQSYSIIELIEGETLSEYIIKTKKYPEELLYMIGSMCAAIHSFEYV